MLSQSNLRYLYQATATSDSYNNSPQRHTIHLAASWSLSNYCYYYFNGGKATQHQVEAWKEHGPYCAYFPSDDKFNTSVGSWLMSIPAGHRGSPFDPSEVAAWTIQLSMEDQGSSPPRSPNLEPSANGELPEDTESQCRRTLSPEAGPSRVAHSRLARKSESNPEYSSISGIYHPEHRRPMLASTADEVPLCPSSWTVPTDDSSGYMDRSSDARVLRDLREESLASPSELQKLIV